MIIEEHLDFQQWEGTNNLKEAHKTQNAVVGRIPRCLPPLLRRNSKSLWFHLLWLTYHNLLHPECQHTEIAFCSCSLYSWSFGWSLPEKVVASKIIWKYCEVWHFMTIGPLFIHCPTFFKDPRIRIPSFDEAMREILSYREGKATSTRRRKHQKKRWLWMPKYFWMCCIVLASGKMWSFKGKKWFASRFASFYHLMPFAQATSAGQNHHWCLEDQLCAIWVQANVIDVIWLFRYSPRWGWRVWLPLGSSRTKPRKLAPCDFELKAEIFFSNPDWKVVHVTLSSVVSLEWKLQR